MNIATTPTADTTILPINSLGRNIYVISDLHIASGLNSNGNYDGTENFFADDSFVRFIDHLQAKVWGKGGILIINGDFIDFLRICDIPAGDDFLLWQSILEETGIQKTITELEASITDKERKYGLKTDDYKSVWKAYICSKGHKHLFRRLAQWILEGNDLILTKGNHDLEWYWPAVQRYFCQRLAQLTVGEDKTLQPIFQQSFNAHIFFSNHAVLVDNKIHIEHGHKYERTTTVDGGDTLANGAELNLPFGSFFNRYLINRLELAYPFLDNVRPSQNILPVLLRERFTLGIKILFQYLPFAVLIVPKGLYRYVFKYLFNFLFIVVLPIAITLFALWQSLHQPKLSADSTSIWAKGFSIIQNFGALFLSYIFGRILSMTSVKAPASFSGQAEKIIEMNPAVEAVFFGHTHNPEQKHLGNNKWYFNTGTWIPIFETSSADVRLDKTYTFIAINCGAASPCSDNLQRWNDDAERVDQMILEDKK